MKYALVVLAMVVTWTLASAAGVDDAMMADDGDGTNWPTYGRTFSNWHASPLGDINAGNAGRLGLAWSMELPGITNGATVPLAVDGVLYFTVGQSMVHAVDAVSGRLLWKHDPEVTRVAGHKLRYTWGPRGLAVWKDKVYVGTTDGRLIALDAATGKQAWSVLTVTPEDSLTLTGPPRVFGGLVVIGNAGSEWGAVRGYVTAYDAETGAQRWRFYTVPGNPADGFEDEAMEMAAKTWTGEWWKLGGGGTVWHAITYDQKYNRLYIGTGNGAPWNRKIRSPEGGDNLFLCSIIALDADTGRYLWHYQTVPGETWDYNSSMDITLATLEMAGEPREVILHAPKNGFFYVLDRATGRLLSAEKSGKATWAERIDLETGRPVEAPGVRYESSPALIWPGGIGSHNWHPMSFNQESGLVFIPTMEIAGLYDDAGVDRKRFTMVRGDLNTGLVEFTGDAPPDAGRSALIAWDPAAQREVWRVDTPGLWNGGTLSTAGGLVFQGQSDGMLNAYATTSGQKLWSFDAKMGITGAPITYEVDGRQYVSVVAGWGAAGPAFFGSLSAQHGWQARVHPHRVLTFALDGKAVLPPTPPPLVAQPVDDPALEIDPVLAKRGESLYARRCNACHGLAAVAGGFAPDLRASPVGLDPGAFRAVVQGGALELAGMPRFGEFGDEEVEALRLYLRKRARESLEAMQAEARTGDNSGH
ncbi:MAG: PQQ-dependent dehydrogenase, methanol/ethanol family [Steroidobacteraceae bacterium]